MIGPYGPARHRWHLACEFSQWIEAAATEEASNSTGSLQRYEARRAEVPMALFAA